RCSSIQCYFSHLDILSFPTRRSSDLSAEEVLINFNIRTHLDQNTLKLVGQVADIHHSRKPRTTFEGVQTALQIFDRFSVVPIFLDRKSTRLNSSHVKISYAVFCLKKK